MDNQKPILVTPTVLANESEPALPLAPSKEFVEPEVSEPIDILAAPAADFSFTWPPYLICTRVHKYTSNALSFV
jgi:hypothetical protein